MISKRRN